MTPLPSRLAPECMDSEPARAAQNTIDPDPLSADDQRSVGGRDRHDNVFHLFFVLGWLHGRGVLEDEEACGGINLYSEDGTLSGASAVYKGQTQRAFCSDERLYRFHLSFLVVLVFGKVAGAGGSGMGSCGNVYGECSGQRERDSDEDGVFFFSWKPVVSGRLPWTRASVCSDRNHGCVVGGTSGTYRTTTKYSNQDFFLCSSM